MKQIITVLLIFAFFSAIPSCTKTNNVTTTVHDTTTVITKDTVYLKKDTVYLKNLKNPITGLWAGTYKLNSLPNDSFYYSFTIQTDGTMFAAGNGTNGSSAYATGPWSLTGTAFTASVTSMDGLNPENVQALTATYDSVGGTIKGSWIFTQGGSATGPGTYKLKRVQP